MGTSKRNLDKKIKKLLQQNPTQDISKTLPQITVEVLEEKRLLRFINENAFKSAIVLGLGGLSRIRSGEMLSDGVDYEELKKNPLTQEEVISKILDTIEEECEDELSEIMIQAFKLAMADTLILEKDALDFVFEFCFNLVYLIVRNDVLEAISDVYEFSHEQINSLIKEQARLILKGDLSVDIKGYVENPEHLSFDQFIKGIAKKAEDISFGEF